MGLLLAAVEVTSPDRWRWLLSDEDTGAALADHSVRVDRGMAEWAGFTDLYGWVRVNADPDPARRISSSAALVDRVGRWITTHLVGDAVVAAIADQAPTTVRVQVPDELGFLRLRPLELAHHNGRPLASGGEVAFVYQLTGTLPSLRRADRVERGGVRMVAVFSQPDHTSILALRRERYALTRLVRRLAARTGRAIELEVLQYGVTRTILADRVAAEGGCDLLHISAHGDTETLLLEHPDGSPDPVPTTELIRLLRPARGRVKLAVVSACESAAPTLAETLHWLHIDTLIDTNGAGAPDPAGAAATTAAGPAAAAAVSPVASAGGQPAVGLARRLGLELGCAVVAMRYPVVDEFAIRLADRLYHNLFQQRLPLHTATCRAVADTLDGGPDPTRPPVSAATPALLTPTPELADLRFDPPRSTVDLADLRLVGFPDEPARFVGRAAAMARATTALAPDSGSTGVVFHGMAGAGKTACALELAYRHRDTFTLTVFWQAPLRPDQWAGALTNLALTLEDRLGEHHFAMVDKIGTTDDLRRFLPVLRATLTHHGLLLVLDNLETLLTVDGQWRDPQWADLIQALTGHGGLARVVMTSRTRPTGPNPGVVVLPVHALSRNETVLLARELPHLGRLLHTDGSNLRTGTGAGAAVTAMQVEHDRELVRRTLTLVQGHPKLLELADAAAADPDTLTTHLDAAEAAADTGQLTAFLTHGDSSLDPDGFLTILTGWTTSTLATLPQPARLLLQALCTIEDDDRTSPVIGAVWPALWQQLHPDTIPADLDPTLDMLAAAALIHPEPHPDTDGQTARVRYRIHPGVADTVHTTTPAPVITSTRQTLAGFWSTVYTQATRGHAGEQTPLVVRAGLAAAPYLLALSNHTTASMLLEHAVMRDQTPAAAQAALPYLRSIAEATGRAADIGILARVVARVDPSAADQLMREALRRAGEDGDHRLASGIAGDLINLLRNAGRLSAALDLTDIKADHTRRAGLGPWTQLADQGWRLQILHRMGHPDQVLTETLQLREQMAHLPDQPGDNETVRPWNVRETLLNLGTLASTALGRWQTALDLAHEEITSRQQRGAGDHDIAAARFNTYGPLLNLGRLDQADAVLLACQQVFDTEQDLTLLARTLMARADLASRRDHRHDATTLQRTALRLNYVNPQPDGVATSHHNLGLYLTRGGGDPGEAIAHHLAATLLGHLIGDTHHTANRLRTLASWLRESPGLALPATLADLAAVVERVEGVRYSALIGALTGGDTALADQAFTELIRTVRTMPAAESGPGLDRHLAAWEPVLAALLAATRGNAPATQLLTGVLDRYAEHPDWAQLVDRLRRIHTGDRDPDQLLAGLDPVDTAITQRALDALAGHIQLTATPDQPGAEPDDDGTVDGFIRVVVAAAHGDAEAATTIGQASDGWAADPGGAVIADRIRRIVAGDRDRDQLTAGLDNEAIALVAAILERLAPPPTADHQPGTGHDT